MNTTLTITELASGLRQSADELVAFCSSLDDSRFFHEPVGKWSPARQVNHLTRATRTATFGYTIPRFLVRWAGGTPNRPSRSFDQLVEKYKSKLAAGGKASAPYVPSPVSPESDREKIMARFRRSMDKMASSITRKWNEEDLEKYIVPHPLLGRITLRELAYFTIYHTRHHMETIRNMSAAPLQV